MKGITIETINITSMNKNGHRMMEREADSILFQEHSMSQGQAEAYQRTAAAKGWTIDMGPCDPGNVRPTGGVGIAVKKGRQPIRMEPCTKDYEDMHRQGRLAA